MQRLVSRLGMPVGAAAAAGATVRAQQPQHGTNSPRTESSGTRLVTDEQEDFVHIGMQAQRVQEHEVSQALTKLAALGGVDLDAPAPQPSHAAAPIPAAPVMSARPLIEEIDGDSDAGSEGSAANLLMAAGEYEPFGAAVAAVGGEDGLGAEPTSLELLTASITNLLNDTELMGAIEGRLAQDPAFVQLVSRQSPGLALPAPARVLLLEELESSAGAASHCEGGEGAGRRAGGTNPLMGLLTGIQRGVAEAAVHIGEAFCHLGNLLRGLGENLRTALTGADGAAAGPDGTGPPRSVERAILRVACVVAVLVATRRMVALPVARMAV